MFKVMGEFNEKDDLVSSDLSIVEIMLYIKWIKKLVKDTHQFFYFDLINGRFLATILFLLCGLESL